MAHLKQLIHEIHRRSLWQVLGIYLVGSWLALQVVDTLAGALNLPDWAPPLALLSGEAGARRLGFHSGEVARRPTLNADYLAEFSHGTNGHVYSYASRLATHWMSPCGPSSTSS